MVVYSHLSSPDPVLGKRFELTFVLEGLDPVTDMGESYEIRSPDRSILFVLHTKKIENIDGTKNNRAKLVFTSMDGFTKYGDQRLLIENYTDPSKSYEAIIPVEATVKPAVIVATATAAAPVVAPVATAVTPPTPRHPKRAGW
ncbi:MAG: hypothetical protein AAB664_04335 [Patescibacteria group bacterium]